MIFESIKLFFHQYFLFSSLYFFFSFSLLFISLPCIPGTFQNEVKKASCKDCDAGQFRPSKNGDGTDTIPTTCTSCFPGTYQQEFGQVSCLPCFPGEYFSIFTKNFIKNNDYNTYNKLIRINLLFLFEIFFSSNFLLLLILAV